jgi:acyl dehydratase
MIDFKDQDQLNTLLSEEFSEWSSPVKVTQKMIDGFAEISGDTLWIHTDPERCEKHSPFGSTIAHGFLVLSMLSRLGSGEDATAKVSGYKQIMNYGSDKLRFMAPVLVDSDIQGRNRVAAIEVSEHKTKMTMEWQVSVVGAPTPSLVYQLAIVFI